MSSESDDGAASELSSGMIAATLARRIVSALRGTRQRTALHQRRNREGSGSRMDSVEDCGPGVINFSDAHTTIADGVERSSMKRNKRPQCSEELNRRAQRGSAATEPSKMENGN